MPATKKLLVVIGVTGAQGGSVARYFLTHESNDWRVRGVTRNTASASARALLAAHPGLELVNGDLDSASTLDAAFTGADAIFLVTDFWQFLRPNASTFAEARSRGIAPNVLAMEKEIAHGKNGIDAAARAHRAKPLHRFVFSTLSDSKRWSRGAITHNLHFDGKAACTAYLRQENPALAAVTSFLQVGHYLANWRTSPAGRPYQDRGPAGPPVIVFPKIGDPAHTDPHPLPFVHPPTDTGPCVHALLLAPAAPPGTTLLGCAGRRACLTFEQYCALFGSVHGVATRPQIIAVETVRAARKVPEWLAQEVGESARYVAAFGWDGGEEGVKLPEEVGVRLEDLTDVEEWIRREEWGGVV